jgi:hypothetical protein
MLRRSNRGQTRRVGHRGTLAYCAGILLVISSCPVSAAPDQASAGLTVQSVAGASIQSVDDGTRVVTPAAAARLGDVNRGWWARAGYLVDVISGASVDVVSAASQAGSGAVHWNEVRHVGTLGGEYKPASFGIRADSAFSTEPDHLFFSGSGMLEWDVGSGPVTLLAGYSRSRDVIGRTGTPFSKFSHGVDEDQLTTGVAIRSARSTDWLLLANIANQRGDATDPYRYVPFFTVDVAPTIENGASAKRVNAARLPFLAIESLPATRDRYIGLGRLIHRFGAQTLDAVQRVYVDSWSVVASTTQIACAWSITPRWTLTPRLRLHVQTGADFWHRAYAVSSSEASFDVPRYRSGDRRLSPLETSSGGLDVSFAMGSADRPAAWSFLLGSDFANTQYFDALYVTSRNSLLTTFAIQGAFE